MIPKPFSIGTGVFHQPVDWSDQQVAHFTRFASPLIRDRLVIFLSKSSKDEPESCLTAMSLIYADAPLMLDVLVFTLDSSPTFSLDHATPLIPDQLGFRPHLDMLSSPPTHHIQRFPHLLIAGTFDHLHCGHKLLLAAAAFTAAEKLTVALTDGDALLGRKKFKAAMQTLSIRTHAVSEFLLSLAPDLEIALTVTTDVVGPAEYLQADAIAVTAETLPGADVVNKARIAAGQPPLEAVVLPILSTTSDKVSSTHTREFIAEQAGGEDALNILKQRWIEAGGDEEWWSKICLKYAEPWRHYHTLKHVLEMISAATEDHDLHLAAFFHDLVYVPSNTDNEEQSVIEFQRFASDRASTDFVTSCITASKSHLKHLGEASPRLRRFLELDLAILAAAPERYDEYAGQIRLEYTPAVYTADAFKSGRTSFLTSLLPSLESGNVFTSEEMNRLAADNIRRELAS